MKFVVQIISKETIKPSSPTPYPLHRYQLSFLDQIQPTHFMPFVMFYPRSENNTDNGDQCEKMKKSLSQALTIFYPLAGRIKDNTYVDCNDEGVYFIQAKANCHLSDILDRRDPQNNHKLISLELDAAEIPAMVQLTFFKCGGLAVCFRMSHKLGDALSFIMFLNCWAAIARGDDSSCIITPQFESAVLLPPKDGIPSTTLTRKNNVMTKRFVFNASSLATLRDKYTKDGVRPSRVEALSAFIWGRFLAATQDKSDQGKLHNVIHAVNLRPRVEPPLSNNYFGNIISELGVTEPKPFPDAEDGFADIMERVRDSIRKVNPESVLKKLQETILGHSASVMKEEVVSFRFTSLCRFPYYDADFGWGKPEWVAAISLINENLAAFFDTKSGDGIEAWINLNEKDMVKFETDKEILSYVS